jgi:hypothetical protein
MDLPFLIKTDACKGYFIISQKMVSNAILTGVQGKKKVMMP